MKRVFSLLQSIRVGAVMAILLVFNACDVGGTSGSGKFSPLEGTIYGVGGMNGTDEGARLGEPIGVATDVAGNVYIADYWNNIIRKITPAGVMTTLAGTAGVKGSADGIGANARFGSPTGVATDVAGNVYVADYWNHTIRKVTPMGVVSTLAGTPGMKGSRDGVGAEALFNYPEGVATDAASNVYVADTHNHTIRKITPDGVVTTLAGTAGVDGSMDGDGVMASFNFPFGVCADAAGNVYVGENANSHTIRKITPAGAVTTVVAHADLPNFVAGNLPGHIGYVGDISLSATTLYLASIENVARVANIP